LIGGDTTRGPLNICITVFGEVPEGNALLRSGARVGDDVYVSGTLGDACLALQELQRRRSVAAAQGAQESQAALARLPAALTDAVFSYAIARLERPTPRVALGLALRGIATAAADISDGLLGDLGHILARSGVGATLDTDTAIHLIAAYAMPTGASGTFDQSIGIDRALQCVLNGGDDYELVFTAPPSQRSAVQAASSASATAVTRIGTIESTPGLRLVDANGTPVAPLAYGASFDHFAP
jgi:thiamine-monophosphate kinase